jgi:hypothetical protein
MRQVFDGLTGRIRISGTNSPGNWGGLALIAGIMVGLALPETKAENEMFGGARDQALARAKNAEGKIQDRAVAAANDAIESA